MGGGFIHKHILTRRLSVPNSYKWEEGHYFCLLACFSIGPPSAFTDSSNITLTAMYNEIRLWHGLSTIHRQVRAVNSSPGHDSDGTASRRRAEAGFITQLQEGANSVQLCAFAEATGARVCLGKHYTFKAAIYRRKHATTPRKLGLCCITEQNQLWI